MSDRQYKIYNASDVQCDDGKREVVSIINTAAIDRDNEVVQPKGMRRKDFNNNPVVFANHSYMSDPNALPIGVSKWIKASTDENGNDILIAKTRFSDATAEARDVFGLIQDKVLNAFSIGFQALRASKPSTAEINSRPELKTCKNIVRDWNLYEYSVVGLPCNQECLGLAVSKGLSKKVLDLITDKDQNTENAIEEIVSDIKPKKLYDFEIKKLIAERIDKMTKAINADAVIARSLTRLKI